MRLPCPLPLEGDYWIIVPDEFKGRHAQRYDQAVEASRKYDSSTLSSFAAALALLDDWHLPGLTGRPENWDLSAADLPVIAWVIGEVLPRYRACFVVPKNSYAPSLTGTRAAAQTTPPGTSEGEA